MTSDEDQRADEESGTVPEAPEGLPLEPFTGLADLDDDLRTMSQNSTEVERWRRLSTRGLTPTAGIERDSSIRGLAAPIVSDDAMRAEPEADAAVTAPGTLAAPDASARAPSAPPDPDSTAQRRALTPEVLAELDRAPSAPTARKSFAPPRDAPSAPPGSRVVLPREASEGLAAPRPSSRPAVKVPRPSQPPVADDAAVRGWRPSDPAHAESDEMPADVVIPPPARLPNMGSLAGRTSSSPPPAARGAAPPAAPPAPPASASPTASAASSARPPASRNDDIELDGRVVVLGVVAAVLAFFGLYYLLFL